jgi:hypothetical protein
LYQTTLRYNPEDSNLHTRRHENLKSYVIPVTQRRKHLSTPNELLNPLMLSNLPQPKWCKHVKHCLHVLYFATTQQTVAHVLKQVFALPIQRKQTFVTTWCHLSRQGTNNFTLHGRTEVSFLASTCPHIWRY